MKKVFDETNLRSMSLRNRFVRSATGLGVAGADGSCTPELIDVMTAFADGGIGLVITGLTAVTATDRVGQGQMQLHSDDLVSSHAMLTDAIHKAGGKIAIQVAHGGLMANQELNKTVPLGPSPLRSDDGAIGRAMTVDEIDQVASAFGQAAKRARRAGYDAIQIHGAHGFLISQFLSSYFNHRSDEYGGSIENRTRILLEIIGAVRDVVGSDYPVLLKINTDDKLEGGNGVEDMVYVAGAAENAGVDAIELSGGTVFAYYTGNVEASFSPTQRDDIYYKQSLPLFRDTLKAPIILVGGIRSLHESETLVQSGQADYISFSRPLIREPGLVNRWASGNEDDAHCISCNQCVVSRAQGKGLRCVHVA